MKRLFSCLFPQFCALLFLAGCATQKVDWNARVGSYSFDQAVLDFGPPDKQAKLTDGVMVAEWVTRRGYRMISPAYGFHDCGGWGCRRHAFPPMIETESPDYFLRLTFDADGRLKAWKKFAR